MNFRKIVIDNCTEPMRLDRYIRSIYPGITQGALEKLLRKKLIKVNGMKQESGGKIVNNDILEVAEIDSLNEFERPTEKGVFIEGDKILAAKLTGEYKVFEDENILVVNKPTELASQGGSGIAISIANSIEYLNSISSSTDPLNDGLRIVHRLDKSTSGIFLLAKNRLAAKKLTTAFADRTILKKYVAVLDGIPRSDSGVIKNQLEKDIINKIQIVTELGDYAETSYKVLLKSDLYTSLALFAPKTGRMHQIRVHSKCLDCPIVGDTKYGNPRQKEKNLYLHAYEITIPSTAFGKEYKFQAGFPEHFKKFVKDDFKVDIEEYIKGVM